MYIPLFFCGVGVTLIVEFVVIVAYSLCISDKGGGEEEEEK
jgi:hypothetical protein